MLPRVVAVIREHCKEAAWIVRAKVCMYVICRVMVLKWSVRPLHTFSQNILLLSSLLSSLMMKACQCNQERFCFLWFAWNNAVRKNHINRRSSQNCCQAAWAALLDLANHYWLVDCGRSVKECFAKVSPAAIDLQCRTFRTNLLDFYHFHTWDRRQQLCLW